MPTFTEIPLINAPQKLRTVIAGKQYQFKIVWNQIHGAWILDIADQSGLIIITGIALVPGADLLEQHRHLGMHFGLRCFPDGNINEPIRYDNLGTTSHLVVVTQ